MLKKIMSFMRHWQGGWFRSKHRETVCICIITSIQDKFI